MGHFPKKKKGRFLTRNNRRLLLILLLALTLVLGSCTTKLDEYDVKYVFLDAGQGDSSVVMTNDGHCVMIDTGTVGYTDKIISSLLWQNVSVIDILILTHNHEDHVAGTIEILENFDVKELWCIDSTQSYISEAIESVAKSCATEIRFVDEGVSVSLGKETALNVEVLCAYAEGDKSQENENAIVVSVSYRDFSALYMSDTGNKTEKYLLENHSDKINCDILKVGHHSSDSSSSEEFIKAADPQVAVVSCEKNNPYGHPHDATLSVLEKYCEYTMFTYNGNFEVKVKGSEIIFENKS